jgi:hypothetical protein
LQFNWVSSFLAIRFTETPAGAFMEIRSINPAMVQVLVPHRDPILQFFAVEKEWFATDDNQFLGAVIFHRTNDNWAYIVFGPDQRGCFRWIAGEANLLSREDATEKLRGELLRVAECGQTVFRRPLRLIQGIRNRVSRRRAGRMARRTARMEA